MCAEQTETREKKQIPIKEGLFTWPDEEPQLLGSRCKGCGVVSFPRITSCPNPNCQSRAEVEVIKLNRKGVLDTYSIMMYQPPFPWKGPESMLPMGQGFVKLPEGICILSVLTSSDPNELKIGGEMELVIEKLYEDEDGNEVMSYKFKPM